MGLRPNYCPKYTFLIRKVSVSGLDPGAVPEFLHFTPRVYFYAGSHLCSSHLRHTKAYTAHRQGFQKQLTLSVGPIPKSYRWSHDYTSVLVIPPADSGQKLKKRLPAPDFVKLFSNAGEHWRPFTSNLRFGLRPQNLHAIRTKEAFQRQERLKKVAHTF